MPVRHAHVGEAEAGEVFCRWHRWCSGAPVLARDRAAFQEFLSWVQRAYPGECKGWWGWPEAVLWPVVQGVDEVWVGLIATE